MEEEVSLFTSLHLFESNSVCSKVDVKCVSALCTRSLMNLIKAQTAVHHPHIISLHKQVSKTRFDLLHFFHFIKFYVAQTQCQTICWD